MAKFRAAGSFTIKGRDLFVVVGDIVDGVVRPGMFLNLPMNSSVRMTARVHAVEIVMGSPRNSVGLCFEADEEARRIWSGLRIAEDGPEVFEITETGDA